MRKKVTKAIFPVAGLGTRFLPATKSVPKEIMTLVDRPLVQYAIDEAREAGIKEFIFVTSRGKGALEDYFDQAPILEQELRKKGKDALLETMQFTLTRLLDCLTDCRRQPSNNTCKNQNALLSR